MWSGEWWYDDKYRLGDRQRTAGYQALCAGRSNHWRWDGLQTVHEKMFLHTGSDSSWVGQMKEEWACVS
jgi:hypothetical protein